MHILGMRINRNRKDKLLFLSQEKYTEKVLDKLNMDKANLLNFFCLRMLNLSKDNDSKDEIEANEMKGAPYASV